LQQRQRCFCECLINTATNGEESTAAVTIRTYASTLLHFHVRCAAVIPLSNDALVQSWLLLKDFSTLGSAGIPAMWDIMDQALQGVGSSNANDLAIWFREKHDYWSAAQLWKTLINRTAEIASKSQYLRSCVAVLAHIPAGTQSILKIPGTQIGALDMEVECLKLMTLYSDRQDEKDSAIERLVELADDPAKMQELGALGKAGVLGAAGMALFGLSNTAYCMSRSLNQIRRGAIMFMECCVYWLELAQSESGFIKWLFVALAFDRMCIQSLCYTCPSELHDYALTVLGEGGVKLVEWHDS
jgi:hypothetical protein